MCGRVNVHDNEAVRLLLSMLGMTTWPSREPRFNVAPTQRLDVVVLDEEPTLVGMSWGISLPMKGKSGKTIVKRVSNARDDKLWASALWRPMVSGRRALIPVNGFYEWVRRSGKTLQAWHISPREADAMFLAGLYRVARTDQDSAEVTIVTTAANDAMRAIHDRMPVLFTSVNEAGSWLAEDDREALVPLLRPAEEDALTFTPVSDHVNKAANDGPRCIERVALP